LSHRDGRAALARQFDVLAHDEATGTPTRGEPHERTLGFVLHDVARLMRKRFEQRARAENLPLTRSQWQVLSRLALTEGINQTSLAQLLEIEPITLVRLLDRLEASGLIERRADPQDRRAYVLFLTPAAHPMLTRIRTLSAKVRADAMDGIAEADREQLINTLLKIKANVSKRVCAESAKIAVAPPERADG
jgi:MarR family transcriptional regulator, transcriptional regulator for hemolysin